MELAGTPEQQLVFLNMHWGRMYEFTAPDQACVPWTAEAKSVTRMSRKRSRPQRCCTLFAPTTPRRSSQGNRGWAIEANWRSALLGASCHESCVRRRPCRRRTWISRPAAAIDSNQLVLQPCGRPCPRQMRVCCRAAALSGGVG
jgi:hypothetical protein